MTVDTVNALVRPVSAILVVAGLVLAFLAQVFGLSTLDLKDAFLSIGSGIIGWYFGKREAEKAAQQGQG